MTDTVQYVGFWARVGAALIDSILVCAILIPLVHALFGLPYAAPGLGSLDALRELSQAHDVSDLYALLDKLSAQEAAASAGGSAISGMVDSLIGYGLPALAALIFWLTRQATPGKMLIGAKIVDADTGGPLKPGQALLRYVGYFASTIPFCLGLIWVGIDSRKQGWHDKIAGTLVVKVPRKS